jgi:hypothetical protein
MRPVFEQDRAQEVERRVAPDGIVETVNISRNGDFGLGACMEDGAPDEL